MGGSPRCLFVSYGVPLGSPWCPSVSHGPSWLLQGFQNSTPNRFSLYCHRSVMDDGVTLIGKCEHEFCKQSFIGYWKGLKRSFRKSHKFNCIFQKALPKLKLELDVLLSNPGSFEKEVIELDPHHNVPRAFQNWIGKLSNKSNHLELHEHTRLRGRACGTSGN